MAPAALYPPHENALVSALESERARLVRFCARFTGDATVAEDLAQETLYEAWRAVDRLTDASGVSHWLTAIARNVCLRWMRQHRREQTYLPRIPLPEDDADALSGIGGDAGGDPVDELERADLAHALDRALAGVPPETRAVLVARCVDDLPQAEVAARLGLSKSAVGVRLHRGKAALRAALGDGVDHVGNFPLADDGWQETRMWCPWCGRSRIQGHFDPRVGELRLRCPHCYVSPDTHVCHHISYSGLFEGVSGFKPAFTRVLRWATTYYTPALETGSAPCLHCGRPAPLRMMEQPTPDVPDQRGIRPFSVLCARCEYPDNYSSFDFLALGLPESQRFWREHSRIRTLPPREVEAQGRNALVLGYESMSGAARLDVVVARDAFEVLATSR